MAVKRALKGFTSERAPASVNEQEETLQFLAENVRHANSLQQSQSIDMLLAVYFRVTGGLGEFGLDYYLPVQHYHIIGRRFAHPSIIRYSAGEGYQVSQCSGVPEGLDHSL